MYVIAMSISSSSKTLSQVDFDTCMSGGDWLPEPQCNESLEAPLDRTILPSTLLRSTSSSTAVACGLNKGRCKLGHVAVKEMNHLGVMFDLPHVSHKMVQDICLFLGACRFLSFKRYSMEKH